MNTRDTLLFVDANDNCHAAIDCSHPSPLTRRLGAESHTSYRLRRAAARRWSPDCPVGTTTRDA
jgi:hypothetical protein